MATYRIYYLEREPADPGALGSAFGQQALERVEFTGETEWEESYDAPDTDAALDAFFADHGGRDGVRLVEEDGAPRDLGEYEHWDIDRTYVWVEDGKLMEYQGLDVATPGMVACPLCDGAGEVDEETAERFAEEWQSDEDDED